MSFFLKVLSLVVASVDMYIMYRWDKQGDSDEFSIMVTGPTLLIGILMLIWWGDFLSERDEELGRWCPAFFVKIVGWCFLFAPIVIIVIFVLSKIK